MASMSVIILGNTPDAAKGPDMLVPSVTRILAVLSAFAITAFEHVSSAIFNA
jgi:hypothetical protein